MSKLRIAVITTFPPGKGSLNEYAYHFVRSLRQKPEVREVILLVDELPQDQTYPVDDAAGGAPIQIIPSWRFGALSNTPRLLRTLRRLKPDVVLFNLQFASFGGDKVSASLGLLTPALARLMGIPTVVLMHNIMETIDLKKAGFGANLVIEKATRLVGTLVTRLLLTSDLVALTIPKYVEILEKKYRVSNVLLAPHGSFTETKLPSFEPTAGPRQIMTFGKFGTYKRVELLLEAFRQLKVSARGPLELVIAGTDSPNAAGYLEGIRRQCLDLPEVRFTGYVAEENVPQIFGEAAVVVFPYNSTTGSSGVLHQAGEYAKAVVLPHLGDLAEVIAEEGYTGEFFEPEDAKSLAAAIARVLDDPVRLQEIGVQNYLAATGLPIDEVVDWYLLHMQSLVKGQKF